MLQVPRDTIERAAGFLIFNQLPKAAIRSINGEELDLSESDDDDF